MKYRLKKGAQPFTVIEGECAGVSFKHGPVYDAVPLRNKKDFDAIPDPPPPEADKKSAPAKPAAEQKAGDKK
jgi:hypothetical protein